MVMGYPYFVRRASARYTWPPEAEDSCQHSIVGKVRMRQKVEQLTEYLRWGTHS